MNISHARMKTIIKQITDKIYKLNSVKMKPKFILIHPLMYEEFKKTF